MRFSGRTYDRIFILAFVSTAPSQEQRPAPESKKIAPNIELSDGDTFVFLWGRR